MTRMEFGERWNRFDIKPANLRIGRSTKVDQTSRVARTQARACGLTLLCLAAGTDVASAQLERGYVQFSAGTEAEGTYAGAVGVLVDPLQVIGEIGAMDDLVPSLDTDERFRQVFLWSRDAAELIAARAPATYGVVGVRVPWMLHDKAGVYAAFQGGVVRIKGQTDFAESSRWKPLTTFDGGIHTRLAPRLILDAGYRYTLIRLRSAASFPLGSREVIYAGMHGLRVSGGYAF